MKAAEKIAELLLKAKDINKLTKKVIINKRGHQQTVYVGENKKPQDKKTASNESLLQYAIKYVTDSGPSFTNADINDFANDYVNKMSESQADSFREFMQQQFSDSDKAERYITTKDTADMLLKNYLIMHRTGMSEKQIEYERDTLPQLYDKLESIYKENRSELSGKVAGMIEDAVDAYNDKWHSDKMGQFNMFTLKRMLKLKNISIQLSNLAAPVMASDLVNHFQEKFGIEFEVEENELAGERLRKFKEWFRDSKIVDENNKAKHTYPIQVFHATGAEFDEFSKEHIGKTDAGWFGRGFYFTTHKGFAEEFAKKWVQGDKKQIKTFYLSVQNPIIINLADTSGNDVSDDEEGVKDLMLKMFPKVADKIQDFDFVKRSSEMPGDNFDLEKAIAEAYPELPRMNFDNLSKRNPISFIRSLVGKPSSSNFRDFRTFYGPVLFTMIAKANGYDGVIVNDSTGKMKEIVAFEPEQIKSVNAQDFDPNSPKLYKSTDRIAELLIKAQQPDYGQGRRQQLVTVHTQRGTHQRLQWVGSQATEQSTPVLTQEQKNIVEQNASLISAITTRLNQIEGNALSDFNKAMYLNIISETFDIIEKHNSKLPDKHKSDVTQLYDRFKAAEKKYYTTPIPAPTREQIDAAAKEKIKKIFSQNENEIPIDLMFAEKDGRHFMSVLVKKGTNETQARFFSYSPEHKTFLGSNAADGISAPRFNLPEKESIKYHREEFEIYLKTWKDISDAKITAQPKLIAEAQSEFADYRQMQKRAREQELQRVFEEAKKRDRAMKRKMGKTDKIYGAYVSGNLPADKYDFDIQADTNLKVDLKKVLNMKAADIAHLVGAPPRSRVMISGNVALNAIDEPVGSLQVRVFNEELNIEMKRYLDFDNMAVSNELFVTGARFSDSTQYESNGGLAARIVSDQLAAVAKTNLFAKVVVTQAAGEGKKKGGDSWNGFYTWPRYGFDRVLIGNQKSKLAKEFEQSDYAEYGLSADSIDSLLSKPDLHISDLMADKKWRSWWKDYGWTLDDLEINIEDAKTFKAKLNFLKEYASNTFGKNGFTNKLTGKAIMKSEAEQGFYEPFSDEQEQLLDKLAEKYGIYVNKQVAPLQMKSITEALKLAKSHDIVREMECCGLQICIENDIGDIRSGSDEGGRNWTTVMRHPYGYIKGTMSADGDEMDCYVGPNPDTDEVYIILQNKPNGDFDENKVMIGFDSKHAAKTAFWNQYDCPEKYFGGIFEMSVNELKQALFDMRVTSLDEGILGSIRRKLMKSRATESHADFVKRVTGGQKKSLKHFDLARKVKVIDDPLAKSERAERIKRLKDMADAIAARKKREC